MKKNILTLIGVAALVLAGCATHLGKATSSVRAAGSNADKAEAYVHAAESGVKGALTHADEAGKALLGQVSSAHTFALQSLDLVKGDLTNVQNQIDALGKENDDLAGKNTVLEHSWGHRFQVIVTAGFWIIVGLYAFHLIGVMVAPFVPAPYGTIIGVAAKIVNPPAWGLWLASKIEQRKAVGAVENVPLPSGTPSDPIHVIQLAAAQVKPAA